MRCWRTNAPIESKVVDPYEENYDSGPESESMIINDDLDRLIYDINGTDDGGLECDINGTDDGDMEYDSNGADDSPR